MYYTSRCKYFQRCKKKKKKTLYNIREMVFKKCIKNTIQLPVIIILFKISY